MWEAVAVAKAAMETGVAQEPVDLILYREQLERRLGKAHEVARMMVHKAQSQPKQVVFPEGENEKVLRACHSLIEENIALPILLGEARIIRKNIAELGLHLEGIQPGVLAAAGGCSDHSCLASARGVRPARLSPTGCLDRETGSCTAGTSGRSTPRASASTAPA